MDFGLTPLHITGFPILQIFSMYLKWLKSKFFEKANLFFQIPLQYPILICSLTRPERASGYLKVLRHIKTADMT